MALLRETFGSEAQPFLVTTGTAANTLALDQVTRPHHCVICPETAHIAVDECGAPERYAGVKLVTVPTEHGKLRPDDVLSRLTDVGDEHRVQPRVVSISQASERGTVYTPDEVAALAELAHAHGLLLHVDGARLANAAAALGVPARAFTTDAGADVLTLGLTKTGALLAEAVVFLRPGLADEFAYARKQGMQLVSKMRFVGAQVEALLQGPASGSSSPPTRTRWHGSWPRGSTTWSRSSTPSRRTPCSHAFRRAGRTRSARRERSTPGTTASSAG